MRRRALAALLALLLAAWAVPAGAALRYTSMEGVPWTYPVPLDVIRDEQDVLRLVNRDHLLDSTYPDQEQAMYVLEEVGLRKATRGETLLRTAAAQALRELFAGAEAAGYKLYVDSAYRSYRTQEVMHYNRTQQRGYDSGSIQLAGASAPDGACGGRGELDVPRQPGGGVRRDGGGRLDAGELRALRVHPALSQGGGGCDRRAL